MIESKVQTKAAVTVAEMARMVGLSRARFYQLIDDGVFPPPVYNTATKRPLFVESQQRTCLEVRRRNCGINGRPVLFYCKRGGEPTRPKGTGKSKAKKRYTNIIDGVRALGLNSATADQVEGAIRVSFPGGTKGVSEPEVIRAVFVHLQRQNSTGNLNR